MKIRKLVVMMAAVTSAMATVGVYSGSAMASSHREAPFITEMPKVDGTDFYMFNSYESGREGFVTLVANYVPLQDPYGGPNYFSMDQDARYEINIDNNGDAREDISFYFHFDNKLKDTQLNINGKSVSIPLINSGPITADDTSNLNVTESYTVEIARGHHHYKITNAASGASHFTKPVDNIGTKSIADYASYAASHVYDIDIPGCGYGRMFVGQRKDSFVVSLGKIFDLVNTNPLGPVNGENDALANKNVTALVLEIPQSCLVANDPVIGAWTSASMRKKRLLNHNVSFERPAKERGHWKQVSRLGMPLVNEIVIGLKDKDKFNASKPHHDGNFAEYVTNPTFPAIVELLFPSAPAPTLFPRDDLIATFLTGINTPATGNLNQPQNVVPAEMLRLNTAIPAVSKGSQNTLGVIGGDNAGFPNGRRPGDDVVDITLRVAMGKLIAIGLYGQASQALAGNAPLTDGAFIDDAMFDDTFPYLITPIAGSVN